LGKKANFKIIKAFLTSLSTGVEEKEVNGLTTNGLLNITIYSNKIKYHIEIIEAFIKKMI
jgi:hypothetical protein